jgi:hypothetical protein
MDIDGKFSKARRCGKVRLYKKMMVRYVIHKEFHDKSLFCSTEIVTGCRIASGCETRSQCKRETKKILRNSGIKGLEASINAAMDIIDYTYNWAAKVMIK